MAMGLTAVADRAWFEIDAHYPAEMAEKRALLRDRHTEVHAALPQATAACAEALGLVVDNLITHHPDWFARDGQTIHNYLTGEHWHAAEPPRDPLERIARLVQEDVCLIQDGPGGPVFTAGVLCFPSRWRLLEKIGRPLSAVHGPVPFYADRLARPVDRFMTHLKPGRIAARLNWSVVDDPALFQPTGKWRDGRDDGIDAGNAGERLFVRVERQTLRRLPVSGAVMFGIRVHVYALARFVAEPDDARRLAAALCALPAETARYKSLPPFRAALLAWLTRRAAVQP